MKASGRDTPPVVIRSPSTRDLEGLTVLLGELGYPTSVQAVERRLSRLTRQANVAVFVADRGAAPIGLATAHVLSVIHVDDPVAMLTALIVDEHYRGQGVGRILVHTVETWAKGCGAYRIVVATGLAREGAHAFYERLGYEHTARRYSKLLSPAERIAARGRR